MSLVSTDQRRHRTPRIYRLQRARTDHRGHEQAKRLVAVYKGRATA